MKKEKYKNINILIVEDNEDHLFFIKKALANFDFNLYEITSGIKAYNYLLNPTVVPDIVLLDNKLPGMNGIEILKKLKEKKKLYNIIFQTIDDSTDLVVEAMNSGATDFILKTPQLKYELPQKINKILKSKRIEIEKQELEAHFKSILESGDDDIWSIDTNYKITAFNQSFKANVLKLTNKEIKIGTDILKVFPKENRDFWKPKYDTVLKGQKLFFEFANEKDKLSRCYDFRLNPIILDGVVTGLSAMGRDVTDSKKSQQELHKKNQLLSKHMNNTPLAAIYTDTNSIIKEWNTAAERIFGYTEKEALGCNIMDLIVPKNLAVELIAVRKNILKNKGGQINQNKNSTKSGKTVTCNWYNTLIKDVNNNPIGIASLIEDITKQTQLESTIKNIKDLTAAKIGEDYFNTVAKSLNKILKADYLIISKYNQDNHSTTSLVYLNKQKILPNITYDLQHTPCDLVSKDGYCFFGNNVDQLFIKDTYLKEHNISGYLGLAIRNNKQEIIGQIVALFSTPISEDLGHKALIKVFAEKAGAEIERKALIDKLSDREQVLLKSQQIANLGSYSLDIFNGTWKNTSVLDTIFGIDTKYLKTIDSWLAIVHPDDRDEMQHYFENTVLKDKGVFNKEYRIKRINDKKERWVHGLGELVFDNGGIPIKMIGTIQDITERKKFENDIKTKNYFLKEAQSIANLISYSYDFKTKIWNPSKSILEMAGLTANKTHIQDWAKLIHPKDKKRIFEIFDKRSKGNFVEFNETYRIIHAKTGKTVWVNHIIQDIKKDASGNLLPILGIIQDITDRKLVELELRKTKETAIKSEQLYKSVFASSPLGIIHFNNKGVITDTNEELVRIVGSSYKKIVGLNMLKDFTDKKMIKAAINTLTKGSGYYEGYYTPVTSNKTTPIIGNFKAIRNSKNEIVGGVGLFEDVTIRKNIEKDLFEKEQQMSSIYDTVADIIFYLSVEGKEKYRFLSVNNQFAKAIAVKKETIIGKLVNEIIPEPSLSLVLKKYKEAVKNKTVVRWEETTQYPSGLKTGDVSVAPVFDKEGNCTHLVGSVHDITARKVAEEKLKISQLKLQEALEITQLGTFIFDDSTNLFESSQICDAILGIDSSFKKDIQGWISLAHPDDYEQVQTLLDNNSETTISQEFRIIRPKNKKTIWVLGHVRKHFDDKGERRIITGTLQDITEQKTKEEALLQYGYIIESSSTEILILDVKTLKIIKTNKAIRKNLGYSAKELHKMTPRDFSPNFNQILFNKRAASLTTKDKTVLFTTVHKRKNGSIFPVEITLQKSTYLNKTVYIAFLKDISQRQRQEQVKEVIYNIAKKANETQNLATLFNFIRNELATLIDTTNFFIALYDDKTDKISTPYMVDEQDSNDDFPKGKSLTGYIIDSKKSLIGNHSVFKSLTEEGKISILGPPSKSWLGVPLVINKKAIGAMVIQSYEEENAYAQEDVALLELIASNISTVIKQKQDFEKIKQSDRILNRINSIVKVFDDKGNLSYISPSVKNILGYEPKELLGKGWWLKSTSSLKEANELIEAVLNSINNGTAVSQEIASRRVRTKEGKELIIEWTNSKGIGNTYISIGIDVTERYEKDKKYRVLVESAIDAVVLTNQNGLITEWNKAAELLFGYTPKEIIGKPLTVLMPQKYIKAHNKGFRKAVKTGKVLRKGSRKIEGLTKNGKTIYIEISFNSWHSGKNLIFGAFIKDITQNRIDGLALKNSEKKFKDLFEKSNDAILIIKNNIFVDCNDAAVKMLKYKTKTEFLNQHPSKLSPKLQPDNKNSLEKAEEMIRVTLKKGSHQFEWIHKKSDGTTFPVDVLLTTISNKPNDKVIHCVWRDISERKRQEQIKEIIYNISNFAQKNPTLDSLLPYIKESLHTVINTDNFYAALYNEKNQTFTTPYRIDKKEDEYTYAFPKGKSFSGYVLDSKKPLLSTDAKIKSLIKKGLIKEVGTPSKCWLGVPLLIKNKAIGVLVVQSYTDKNLYSQKDVALLELVARNVNQSIKQAQDYEQINLLNQALIQSPEAVIVTNKEGIIEYINPAFTSLSGYSNQETIGQKSNMLKSGEQTDSFYKTLWDTITKGHVWEGEFVNKRKDGSKYLVAANISSVKNKKGKITHFIAVEEDITEKRKLERQFINAFVEAQEVEKQSFGEDLHDGISQILSAEAMYIDILIRQNKDRLEGKAKFLTKIKELNHNAIEEARNIAHGLMAKQLKEQGLIKAIEIICIDYNTSRNIDFKFTHKVLKENDISKEIKTHIFRLTQEITTNIIRHSSATKASIILSKTTTNKLKIVIKDNGVGIDFNKLKRDKKGAGLKNIERRITLLNGAMNIDTAPNKGTCFTIEVPLVSL